MRLPCVGYEREIEMFSLDFEEFLWACGIDESAIEGLRLFFDKKEHIDDSINAKFIDYIRKYLFVGGMPEVVNTFLESNNYQSVSQAQNKILKAYEYDIEHYASNKDKPKIRNCYYSIPRQLAKEYTKFQYKCVEKNGSARKYGNSIDWLIDAGLIKCVYNLSLPAVPLRAYEKTEDFKIYVTDIGLLTAMFGFNTQVGLLNNTLTGSAKGGIYENLIFDILMKRGFYLNYYKNHDNSQKIEFVMENSDGIVPIEVKSSRGSTMSLNEFTAKFNPEYAYKLTDGNIGTDGRKITMPHYMAMFI